MAFGLSADDFAFKGSIKGIEPKVDPSSRLVAVRAEIANPEGKLSPGQFVQVRVELPKEDGVIAIPDTALVSSLYGDFVFVVKPSQPAPANPPAEGASAPAEAAPSLAVSQVFVKTGRRSDGSIEIVEGISAGDEVVTAGQNRLSNNTPVRVDNSLTPQAPAKVASGQ